MRALRAWMLDDGRMRPKTRLNIDDFLDIRVHAVDDVGVVDKTLTLVSVTDFNNNVIGEEKGTGVFSGPEECGIFLDQAPNRLCSQSDNSHAPTEAC